MKAKFFLLVAIENIKNFIIRKREVFQLFIYILLMLCPLVHTGVYIISKYGHIKFPSSYLDLGLDILDGITGLNLEGDGLTGQGLHEDLHLL